jgi:hypothetical protein
MALNPGSRRPLAVGMAEHECRAADQRHERMPAALRRSGPLGFYSPDGCAESQSVCRERSSWPMGGQSGQRSSDLPANAPPTAGPGQVPEPLNFRTCCSSHHHARLAAEVATWQHDPSCRVWERPGVRQRGREPGRGSRSLRPGPWWASRVRLDSPRRSRGAHAPRLVAVAVVVDAAQAIRFAVVDHAAGFLVLQREVAVVGGVVVPDDVPALPA